jgi:Spy/CpxP family protein refolding chaperone
MEWAFILGLVVGASIVGAFAATAAVHGWWMKERGHADHS